MKRLAQIVVLLVMLMAVISLVAGADHAADRLDIVAGGPLNTTYLVEGQKVRMVNGRCERPAAPDSAIKTRTTVLGRPVTGDLGGAGGEDAALLLTHDPGGSGIFYYVAAAVSVDGRSKDANAVLLGDRIVPRDVIISNRVVVVRYTDRRPAEPMSAYPAIGKVMALAVKNGQFVEIGPLVEGMVTIGHEVRAFQPCNGSESLWLMGRSPALKAIIADYHRVLPGENTYRPVFAALVGKRVAPPSDGFGAEYKAAFLATHLVRMEPGVSCPRDVGRISSPPPIEEKIAIDVSKLDANGRYGLAGAKRALSYEFCIPAMVPHRTEVEQIDQTASFFTASPGHIGCGTHEILCIGSTHQKDFGGVLRRLAELPYVLRIDQSFFE